LATLTANAFMVAQVNTLVDYVEYVDALRGVLGACIFSELWALGTVIASLCMHMDKKEHHKHLDMVATWTTLTAFNLFILNIVAAVLGHLNMTALIEKLDALPVTPAPSS